VAALTLLIAGAVLGAVVYQKELFSGVIGGGESDGGAPYLYITRYASRRYAFYQALIARPLS
jgi:hypothetical protein